MFVSPSSRVKSKYKNRLCITRPSKNNIYELVMFLLYITLYKEVERNTLKRLREQKPRKEKV
jgi:hypothetical protein